MTAAAIEEMIGSRSAPSLRDGAPALAPDCGVCGGFSWPAPGASFAAVFVFMALYAIEGGFNASQYAAAEPLRMINPRFIGRTENGGPYQLSAEMAERPAGENQPIELVAPVYRTEAGTIMLAPRGIYDEAGQDRGFRRRSAVFRPQAATASPPRT